MATTVTAGNTNKGLLRKTSSHQMLNPKQKIQCNDYFENYKHASNVVSTNNKKKPRDVIHSMHPFKVGLVLAIILRMTKQNTKK